MREVRLLIIASSVAAFMHRFAKEPSGAEFVVEGRNGCFARCGLQHPHEHFHEVVRLYWASRDVDDGKSRARDKRPPQIVGESHAPRGVACHGMDPTVGGTRSG